MTRCDIVLTDAGEMIRHLIRNVEEADIDRPSTGRVHVVLGAGRLTLDRRRRGLGVRIETADTEDLVIWREGLVEQVAQIDPVAATTMRWRGGPVRARAGERPANFRLGRVVSVSRPMPGLRRLVGELDAPLAGDGLHFRLALPPRPGSAAVWPVTGADGTVLWPDGLHALHRRAYTFRAISPDCRRITVDAVDHPGGRTSDWIASARPGAIFGLSGPGGAGVPETDGDLVLAGDMTALPAMARILEALPAARIRAWAACPTQSDADAYFGPGRVTAVVPGRFEAEIAARLGTEAPPDAAWFAGEHETALTLRALFHNCWALGRGRERAVAYWRRDPETHSDIDGDPS